MEQPTTYYGMHVHSELESPEVSFLSLGWHHHFDEEKADCVLRTGLVIAFCGFKLFIGKLYHHDH